MDAQEIIADTISVECDVTETLPKAEARCRARSQPLFEQKTWRIETTLLTELRTGLGSGGMVLRFRDDELGIADCDLHTSYWSREVRTMKVQRTEAGAETDEQTCQQSIRSIQRL
jgi:hypothetical protein